MEGESSWIPGGLGGAVPLRSATWLNCVPLDGSGPDANAEILSVRAHTPRVQWGKLRRNHLFPENEALAPFAMNIAPAHLEALQALGYTEVESRFLYLVATHSGYFTARQFLSFTGAHWGKRTTTFWNKLQSRGH